MALVGWRTIVVRTLAERIGPVAELIVDDTVRNLGVPESEMVPAQFLKFLALLQKELPPDIDRGALCVQLREIVLSQCRLEPDARR